MSKEINGRQTNYPINDMFLERYSPRAMSGEPISKDELMTLFEASRWAPSASNMQPWRFIYAMAGTPDFDKLFSLLIPFNQDWCKRASVLIVTISYTKTFKGIPSKTNSFDVGSAWENLALQASEMDLVAHGMEGFDYERTKSELNIPEDYRVEMMIAIGRHGDLKDLPESLQSREAPSTRRPLAEIVFEAKPNDLNRLAGQPPFPPR